MVTPQTLYNITRDYRAGQGATEAQPPSSTTTGGVYVAGIGQISPIPADDWFDLAKRYEYFRSIGMVGEPVPAELAYKPAVRGALNVNDPVCVYRMEGWRV
jgi:hypothetical protein